MGCKESKNLPYSPNGESGDLLQNGGASPESFVAATRTEIITLLVPQNAFSSESITIQLLLYEKEVIFSLTEETVINFERFAIFLFYPNL